MRIPSAQSPARQLRLAVALIVLSITWIGWNDVASAQAPVVIDKLTFNRERKSDKGTVDGLLRAGAPIAGADLATFDGYFIEYLLPQMAMPAYKTQLPAMRADLRKYFMTGKDGPPYNRLNEITLAMMKFLIKKSQTRPEIIANAVLVIGDLNDNDNGPGKTKPLPEGLKILVSLISNPKLPDAAYVPAMVGIQRHIDYQNYFPLPKDTKEQLTKVLLETLKEKQPPANRTASGQNWIRRVAGEMLASLGDPGANGANVEAILLVIQDPETPILTRCELSSALGKFKYPSNAKIEYGKLALGIGKVVVDAARGELARVEKLNTAGGMMVPLNSRRLSVYFNQGLNGLKGPPPSHRGGLLAAAAGSPDQKMIADIATNVEKMNASVVKAINESYDVDPIELTEMLSTLEAALPKTADVAKLPARAGGADPKLPTN